MLVFYSAAARHGTIEYDSVVVDEEEEEGTPFASLLLNERKRFPGKRELREQVHRHTKQQTNERTNGTLMFTLFLATSSGKAERNEERLEEDKTVCVCGCSGLAATRQQRAEQPHKTHHEAAIHFETHTHNF